MRVGCLTYNCRCVSRPRTESAFWIGRAKCLLEGFLKGNLKTLNSFSISNFRKGFILSDVRSWDCGDLGTVLFSGSLSFVGLYKKVLYATL